MLTTGTSARERAEEVARAAHADQRSPNGRPYIDHPLAVARVLEATGADEPSIVAAILHDVVEHSPLSVAEISGAFGAEVAGLVEALTEDPLIDDWVERKALLRRQVEDAGAPAASIYAADKLVNLADMRRLYNDKGEAAIDLHKAPTLDLRIEAWWHDLESASGAGAPLQLTMRLLSELKAFEQDRRLATATT